MIPPARVYVPEEDIKEAFRMMTEALTSGYLTSGKLVGQFENEFSSYHSGLHAVAVNSGTAALEIILRSFEVAGKEVIVPSNTFIATAAAVVHAGATPVIVDIEADTMSLSPAAVEAAITPRTAGIIVVHIGGVVTHRMPELQQIARRHGLVLIEDNAHSQGSRFNGQLAGTFGDAAAFSFFPTKVMTCGEGGMILTTSSRVDEEARVYRDQGKANTQVNLHVRLGANWRLSELHAAIGLTQLRRVDEFIAARRAIAADYDRWIPGIARVRPLAIHPDCLTNGYKYTLMLDPDVDRERLKHLMREQGVSLSGEVYATPLHLQPVAAGWPAAPCPVAENFAAHHICLPLFANMTTTEAEQVVSALAGAIKEL